MKRACLFLLPVLWILTNSPWAEAQKLYRIGALVADDQFVPTFEGFKKKMAELGYVDGKNVQYDFQNAKGDRETLRRLALMLVQSTPHLIVTSSTTATVPVAKATKGTDLPVVFLSAGNPSRFIRSYTSSGNNLTGITTSSIDLTEKRIELLKELAPGIKRLIALNNPAGPNYEANLKATLEAARKFGLQLTEVHAASGDELRQKAAQITRKMGDSLFIPPDAIVNSAIEAIVQQAIDEKLPSVTANETSVKRGALATYSANYYALGQQGAMLVDKILKGTKPSDLPIEQPSRLRLVINMKTARAIGLRIPKGVLIRADAVIE